MTSTFTCQKSAWPRDGIWPKSMDICLLDSGIRQGKWRLSLSILVAVPRHRAKMGLGPLGPSLGLPGHSAALPGLTGLLLLGHARQLSGKRTAGGCAGKGRASGRQAPHTLALAPPRGGAQASAASAYTAARCVRCVLCRHTSLHEKPGPCRTPHTHRRRCSPVPTALLSVDCERRFRSRRLASPRAFLAYAYQQPNSYHGSDDPWSIEAVARVRFFVGPSAL